MRDRHVVLFAMLFIVLLIAIPVFSTTDLNQSGYQLEERVTPQEEITSSLAECLEAPEGIVAWWPGDWDGLDIVGDNNLEAPSSVTYRNGYVDGAFYFDGSNEVLTAPGTGLAELQTLTIELWVCHVSLPSSIQRYVTLPVEKAVIRHAGNGILQFYMNFGTADNWELHDVSAPGLTVGEYHHVVGTYDGSYMRLYLDGVEVDSEAVTGVVYSDETEVELGSDGEAMWGLIDEVSIYDRALTPLEIQTISDAGSDGKCKPKDIAVIPTSRDFGVVEVGDSASEIVTVRNVGDELLGITDASFESYSCSDFAVTMYSNVVNDPYVGWGIGSGIGGSIYQSFTANATGMVAVSLTLIAGGSFPETGYTTTVRIRSETTDGPILGTSSAFVPGPMTGGHQTEVLFKFSETLPTIFGNTYVIEWVYPESQAILNWMAAHYDSYPGGNYFGPLHIPIEYIDAYFAVFVANPMVDQINDEELDGSLGRVYGYPGSLFQSFVPSEPCLGGVVLGLVAGGTFPVTGLTNEIRIRDGSFDGAILGTTTQFISGPRETGESIYVRYNFLEPLTLIPGHTYVIEWASPYEGSTYLSWLYANDNPYPNGMALLNDGTPIPDKDLLFATYDATFVLPKGLYSDQILKIVVEYTPSSTGKCFGTLGIHSDDLDEAVVDVEFVAGEDIINSNWRVFPVTLDGAISTPEEWAYAEPYMLHLTRSGGWGTPDYFSEPSDETMTVRFMNDGLWLYILYQVPWRGPLSPPDSAGISMWEFIGLGLVSSDASYVGSSSTYDAHGWNGAYWTADTDVGGENNVEGTSTFDEEYYWFEFRKPLDSGDGFDWSFNPGDRIGDRISPNSGTTLELSVWDPDTGSLYGHWAILQLSKGLVSWWPGDKNPLDIVGPNPGSMNFDASFAPGMVGDAFAFDGEDDYIRAASTGINELQQLTIETWVKITELAPNPQRFVTLKGEKAVLRHDGGCSLHQLHFYMNFGGPPWLGQADMHHIRVDNVLYENEWYHVAGTYDGSVMRLYLNGELVGSHDVVGTTFNLDWLELSHQGEALNGLLDEVSIYGYALSQAVIKSIYDAGSAGKPKPTNDVLCPYPISVTSDIELTHNVLCDEDGIIAAKNFIVLDGDGHSLLGSGDGTGIYANWYHGVTINDFVIQDFE
ncbi:MAG: LamG-like jellyroll fold domain-containing protein, partial [Promethearchaeota archaeon]